MSGLNEIVKECIKQHEGGEKFFDALDERIRSSKGLLHAMMTMISMSGINFSHIITSGKFGKVFKDFVSEEYPLINTISVNGSLRKDGEITAQEREDLRGGAAIFVDDSFYSGKTRDKVKKYVEDCGGKMPATFVFYDGSKVKDETVHSMYRYYK